MAKDMDKMKGERAGGLTRAGSRSEAASPTSAVAFSAIASRSRSRAALQSLRADVDYSKYNRKQMRLLRLVSAAEWFPPQRHERHLTSSRFWTVVQKDLHLALKSQVSDMKWIDWASVNRSAGTDVRGCFAATLGLDGLLERRDLGWADSYIRQFYATLWIHPDRSTIKFMFGNQQRELSRDDFSECLGLDSSGARVHALAYPNGNRDELHLPPVEDIRHLYANPDPDAVMEFWKDHNQLNHETAVVHTVTRMSIRPRIGGLESLTTVEIWLLHLLRSAQPVDIVDLMIGEMQEIILTIRRRLPYAPYLIHLFDKKGWLEDGMKKALDQRLKPYKAPKPEDKRRLRNRALQHVKSYNTPKPEDKRRLRNRALQHVKSYNTPKPDDKRRLGTRSLPPQAGAAFDDEEDVELDRTHSLSLKEQALGGTANGEADADHNQHMVLALVPDESRFGLQGPRDAEAGGSGGHTAEAGGLAGHTYDVPPMLQGQIDRQTAILEQMQRQIVHQTVIHEQMQRQIDHQTTILEQMQRQIDRQTAIHEQTQRQIDHQTAIHEQTQRQMQDIRNLAVVSVGESIRCHARHSDVLAILDESFSASCGL